MEEGLTKTCTQCGREQPLRQFHTRVMGSGRQTTRSHCKSCQRSRRYLKQFGITDDEFQQLLKLQHYRCGICQDPIINDPDYKNQYHIDHNHETGKVRGILCSRCNTGLGQFGDSIERLAAAIEYLKANGRKN